MREGIHVVLAGKPNVGKSSLLNRLAGAERAIVTDIPGTTRDTIRETVNIRGVPLHLIDTAGLREAQDPVEKIGIARSHDAISKADIVLWIADATRPDTARVDDALMATLTAGVSRIIVINKTDLTDSGFVDDKIGNDVRVKVSAMTGQGLDALKDEILRAAGWGGGEAVFLARTRHLHALGIAAAHVAAAVERIAQLELCAEELRLAQFALGSITGAVTADDLLGKIFSQFCIGK